MTILSKQIVFEFVSHLKGKRELMLFDKLPEYNTRGSRYFWARGYCAETVGHENEDAIRHYIKNQTEEDKNSKE